jgi:hypothetical protein
VAGLPLAVGARPGLLGGVPDGDTSVLDVVWTKRTLPESRAWPTLITQSKQRHWA